MSDATKWLNVKKAAERIGVSPEWIYRRIEGRYGEAPPFYRRGRVIRIPADEFERWAQQKVIG